MDVDIVFIGDEPSPETIALVQAHVAEGERLGATFYNLGWAMTDTGIASKTNLGILESERGEDGSIVHHYTLKGNDAMKIKVSLTTEDGEVLDQFLVERPVPRNCKPVVIEDTPAQLAHDVRDHVEMRFEVGE